MPIVFDGKKRDLTFKNPKGGTFLIYNTTTENFKCKDAFFIIFQQNAVFFKPLPDLYTFAKIELKMARFSMAFCPGSLRPPRCRP